MKNHYDLSMIVPGIRNDKWDIIFDHAVNACKRYSYEIIFSGPYAASDRLYKEKNVKVLKNYGNPSRAFHLGTRVADGKFICILADDAHLYPDSIDKCLDLLLSNDPEKDIVVERYCEGPGHSGAEPPMGYWTAGYHGDTKQPGVNPEWRLALTPLMSLKRYNELGGIDCQYHHVNFNMLDLGFRNIKDGGKIHLSPTLVMNCDFEPNRTPETSSVIKAYVSNDRDLFYKMYSDNNREVKIDLDNWRESDPIWSLRKF
jgi:hypothetical protein